MSDEPASRSSASKRRRPTAWQWLRYAYGSSLPEDLSEWVLWDVTARGWWIRHLLRATVQMAPLIILAAVFLPGPAVIVWTTCLGGLIIGYIFSMAAIVDANEWRLVKAGYPQGTGESVRAARAHHHQKASAAAHRERLQRSAQRRAARAAKVRHPRQADGTKRAQRPPSGPQQEPPQSSP